MLNDHFVTVGTHYGQYLTRLANALPRKSATGLCDAFGEEYTEPINRRIVCLEEHVP